MASSSKPAVYDLLRPPNDDNPPPPPVERAQTTITTSADYLLQSKTYQQQFSHIYFLRLAALKPIVSLLAEQAWATYTIANQTAGPVDRVLDVRQGELCWVTGTIYLDMPLKPNILEDISADHFLLPPPPREKFCDTGVDQIMLEDESGRLKLTGAKLSSMELVTGVVVAVLGSENSDGEFNVVDTRIPELAPQEERKEKPRKDARRRKIALASGLGISGAVHENLELHMLAEYLAGESGGLEDHEEAGGIVSLILAGNSLGIAEAPADELNTEESKKLRTKKYGYDASSYNPVPTRHLDSLLTSLLPTVPITILPGPTDPATTSLPQQPLHSALFPAAKVYDTSTLTRTTNPCTLTLDETTLLCTAGQNIDDIYKYMEGDDRLGMAERCLRWRIIAPTAPDTLWCYPFVDRDPFVIKETPQVLVIGNQPRFETRVVEGEGGVKCRVVMVPRFDVTGEIVLLDVETKEVEVVRFKAEV